MRSWRTVPQSRHVNAGDDPRPLTPGCAASTPGHHRVPGAGPRSGPNTERQPFCNIRCCVIATQLGQALCDPVDWGSPGSSLRGILQARYWSGLSFPPPEDLPGPGIELASLMSVSCIGRWVLTTSTTWEAPLQSQARPYGL